MRWRRAAGAGGVAAALLGIVLLCLTASAQYERIVDFDSHITVGRDGWLTVTETIAVLAGGEEIKRGIYRDFPTIYDGPLFTKVVVPFEIASVERDGEPEPYHTEPAENGVRIYIGDAERELPPGPHVYRVTYRTGEQLGFFPDHDELYWNVTGNGWAFPIDRATATVVLPDEVPRHAVALAGYTGPQGSTERALTTAVATDGALRFAAARPLDRYEGLTIVASFPKGFVREPTEEERRAAWLRGNRHLVAGAAGLGAVLLYFLIAWLAVGRDPNRGTIIPLFEPPLGLDAAGVRYVAGMAYDERCFAAGLVSLGVKGWLRIEEENGEFTLVRPKEKHHRVPLSAAETRLHGALLGHGESIALEQKNHARLRAAIQTLRDGLALEYEGTMFRLNRRWLWPGLGLSALSLLALGWYAPSGAGASIGMAFIMIWLGAWSFACLALIENVRRGWRDALRPGIGVGSRLLGFFLAIIVTAFALPFLAGEVFGIFAMTQMTSVWAAPLLFALAGTSWLFSYLLKQPTGTGQKVLDQIAGFRMYLETAEGDALRLAPPKTPQLFEKLLPFAIALGVEHAWSERFTDVLRAAAEKDDGAQPHWYRGQSWQRIGASSFASMVGSSLASSVSASSTAPGSRSGSSGGGSSGGGGGGGGGGGW